MRTLKRLALSALLLPLAVFGSDELPVGVKSVLQHRNIPEQSVSIHIANLSSGETLFGWHENDIRTPASVMKLLTTLVALDALGPTYTWKTEAYFLGDVRDQTLHGDLLLKGYGDPFLVTERLWQLQRRLRQAGISHISGELLLDDSWFQVGDYDPGAFDREPMRAYNVAPNALMANFKVVRFLFEPDAVGGGVRIRLDPPLDNITVDNQLSLAAGACRGYRRGIALSSNAAVNRLTFSGRFPDGCKRYALDRTALGHNEFTYGLFRALWQESGGSLDGEWKKAIVPEDAEPDLVFDSLPLADVISMVNKHSNNVMARQLLYTLAAETSGPPGTESAGRAVIEDWLSSKSFDFSELRLDNGAGLSRNARITARHLGELLKYGYESRFMPEFVSSMSLSGLDGTLSRRFRDNAMRGMAHMKTGSLDHVSSIAGYVHGRSGQRYSVVVLVNHVDSHRGTGEEVQEALLRWVREH